MKGCLKDKIFLGFWSWAGKDQSRGRCGDPFVVERAALEGRILLAWLPLSPHWLHPAVRVVETACRERFRRGAAALHETPVGSVVVPLLA